MAGKLVKSVKKNVKLFGKKVLALQLKSGNYLTCYIACFMLSTVDIAIRTGL